MIKSSDLIKAMTLYIDQMIWRQTEWGSTNAVLENALSSYDIPVDLKTATFLEKIFSKGNKAGEVLLVHAWLDSLKIGANNLYNSYGKRKLSKNFTKEELIEESTNEGGYFSPEVFSDFVLYVKNNQKRLKTESLRKKVIKQTLKKLKEANLLNKEAIKAFLKTKR